MSEQKTRDPQIEAMSAIVEALDGLTDDALGGVVAWFVNRYGQKHNAHIVTNAQSHVDSLVVNEDLNLRTARTRKVVRRPKSESGTVSDPINLASLVNWIKSSKYYDAIDLLALRGGDDMARVLIALLAFKECGHEGNGLTSGDVCRLYGQLNVRLHQPNVSTTLSQRSRQFVITNDVRRPGFPVRYRLSHQGEIKVMELLSGVTT